MNLNYLMTKKTPINSSRIQVRGNDGVVSPVGDDIHVVAPVVDGNKLKIQVPVMETRGSTDGDNKMRIEVPIPRNLLFQPARMGDTCHDHALLLVQNYGNFKISGKPARFMFYKDGLWENFEENVMDLMVSGFVSGKPVFEVEVEGFNSLFDFYRMLEIDLKTGKERSISWIDVNGQCFFPKMFIDDEGLENVDKKSKEKIGVSKVNENLENPKIEIELRMFENKEELRLGKRKRESEENEARVVFGEMSSPRWPKVRPMREDERCYQMVKGFLVSGLRGVYAGVMITAVHQCIRTGPMEMARFEVFKKHVEIVRRVRGGDPNVVYAWYGASAKDVDSIMRHGFGMPSMERGSNTHGVGIYLSPVRAPQNSAMMSAEDEYGEKHIILCRVILGKSEKVELGSQQLRPSSVDFDTGVDDLTNPRWYVVWCGNMNTHILPECVVSYKPHISGLQPNVPSPLSTLISKLNSSLPPPKALQLQCLYSSYRESKIAKEIFTRQLRSVVGDEMLRSIILEIRG
ncbi:inactive poly [ADP-ribose] polymerase RCD1-like [Lycium barbarum]|uniref:inactive poly [ADP-ribose] polymerase RCD1-like n=1 Tax=Lycium barbarum TaxID=112863 RepID=UPI00293EB1BF|nr:inactive poly [ADP-ribose] polymerase RCD1-like [Lycium barbarum]XP_060199220.1 inactive poly [ADP-ribose] polymerase RCD1-like [Lycium barbarum]XP_060199221.1 inactive poly [ADP-ribose] polymerase RCD1-like [Lycium barbarum]XP_060199222.1 inactive poly [ADP-ribose] polymerase RCD1-like [Lycium barbarum]XP_060199223.1 inactive poly [ADP-ribose] polymerase RCD1-like [Lycium barbarum]XP_060199224.1 inactive poly [ADP-ribose] polymerase RCD1-like [Lycium barbarum]XP_060199225.1 inactive poly 